MIRFRCWYCNKRYAVKDKRIGERITCTCERQVRVPKKDGGYCRVKTPIDWLVEAIVYGGGGALLGLGLSVLIVALMHRSLVYSRHSMFDGTLLLIPALTIPGFLIGLFGGERGINWIGRHIRDVEDEF